MCVEPTLVTTEYDFIYCAAATRETLLYRIVWASLIIEIFTRPSSCTNIINTQYRNAVNAMFYFLRSRYVSSAVSGISLVKHVLVHYKGLVVVVDYPPP